MDISSKSKQPKKTYLFYDIETTGRNPCFDQVLQFAAIRTDLALQEIERHHITIRLSPDVIPDPEALLIHRISLSNMQMGETEIKGITQIHALLNIPGTLSGGYNTLGFDDEMLRFSFHRHLLPPYTHQWANECGRFDLYPITLMYFLYHPACLKWPIRDGKPSMKLENLNAENQLAPGMAHDAMVDVEATLALARLFFSHQKMWDYNMSYFDKNVDQKRQRESTRGPENIALLVGACGSNDFYQFPVMPLGVHHHYKNQTLWLRLDKPELQNTLPNHLSETTWAVRKRTGEPGFLLPFSDRFIQHVSPERQAILQENISWLKKNPTVFQAIQAYYLDYTYPDVPHVDVQADLYLGGFLKAGEEQLCRQFHQAPLEDKANVVEKFQNPRLYELAMRLMGRHYPEQMTPHLSEAFSTYLHCLNSAPPEGTFIDFRAHPRMTASAALQKISEMQANKTCHAESMALLEELKSYLLKIRPPPQ